MQLDEKKRQLREKINKGTLNEIYTYIEMDGLLNNLQKILFQNKE